MTNGTNHLQLWSIIIIIPHKWCSTWIPWYNIHTGVKDLQKQNFCWSSLNAFFDLPQVAIAVMNYQLTTRQTQSSWLPLSPTEMMKPFTFGSTREPSQKMHTRTYWRSKWMRTVRHTLLEKQHKASSFRVPIWPKLSLHDRNLLLAPFSVESLEDRDGIIMKTVRASQQAM